MTPISPPDAEAVLIELASVFLGRDRRGAKRRGSQCRSPVPRPAGADSRRSLHGLPRSRHRRGIREPADRDQPRLLAKEWLEDPVRWYQQIHPDDKERWSVEAARMFLSGKPLRSAYRVIARDGRVVWFHCEARMVRRADGRPWFIHGVAFDITELKHIERRCSRSAISSRRFSTPWARWWWFSTRRPHRPVQSRLRADHRILVRTSEGPTGPGPVPRSRRRERFETLFEQFRRGLLPGDHESTG